MRNVRFERREHRTWHAFGSERGLAEATYAEVAAAMRISVARVGQIERSAFARIRECWRLIESGVAIDAAVEHCKGHVGRPRKAAA